MSAISLRLGPDPERRYGLVESEERFVVHFKSSVPGGNAAKSLLRLPLMFGRRVHVRKMSLPPAAGAVRDSRPGEAARRLPGYGDDTEDIRDASMNFIRARVGKSGGAVVACYHTYQRATAGAPASPDRDNEMFPSGQLFHGHP